MTLLLKYVCFKEAQTNWRENRKVTYKEWKKDYMSECMLSLECIAAAVLISVVSKAAEGPRLVLGPQANALKHLGGKLFFSKGS